MKLSVVPDSNAIKAPLAEASGVELTYTDSSVSDDTTYYYVVTAVNAEGESVVSNEISVKPGAVPSVPGSPSATKGNAEVSLSWSEPSANGYTIATL